MRHVPVLRAGQPYRSIERVELRDVRTGDPVAEVSQANRGLVARDLLSAASNHKLLQKRAVRELLDCCRKAGELFVSAELPLDLLEGTTQSPEEYVQCQSATTGMPQSLCRANMEKIRFVLTEMERVLAGLSRGVDLAVLDEGWVEQDGRPVSYLAQADCLGAVLPSNSPGVHSLWIPALALKTPVALKPGREEPWTPQRVGQALIAAGFPPEAIGFYPTDYSGATEILLRCDRSMLFGDVSTVEAWTQDPRVQIHGPGWSKVLIGEDRIDGWQQHLELIVESVAGNGGRSCVNASGVWTPFKSREVAEALAERLAAIPARALDDPEAGLAAFPKPEVARAVSEYIDRQLAIPGAEDLTAKARSGGRVAEAGGCTFLLPTVIWCEDPAHPLASCELLFPFVTVVETPQREMPERIGSTLVATVLSDDPEFRRALMVSRNIDRLNLGAVPTNRVSWDQPHEGNLFEHLYKQRAFQAETLAS